jgi:type I restriction enzyme S subunit
MRPPLARVGDLAEQVRGVTYAKEDVSATQVPGFLPVLRAGNITDGGLLYDDLVFVPANRVSEKQELRRHDVVVAASSGSLEVVGKAAPVLSEFQGSFGAFCKVLRPNAKVDPGYFAQFFKTSDYRRRVSALAAGANINNLRKEHLDEMQMPLPPLPDQRRIADILDKADALRAKRRAALAQLDTLTQSIFLDMFGDPATNPKGWPIRAFGRVCETRLGKMLDQKRQTGEHRRPYLRNANVQWFRIDLTSLLEMDFDEDDRRVLRLEPGDLLICEGGEPGRAAVWRGELDECYFQKALHRGRPKPDLANAAYLSWLLWFLGQRGKLSGVTSATIAHLTGEKLAVLPTMLPPLPVQRAFANRLAKVQSVADKQLAASHGLDALFASLQHRAFRGDL